MSAATATAGPGHNNPPLTPFEAINTHVSDLMMEARHWCDGAAIENQAQADEVARLMNDFREAHTAADEARKKENEPFDAGKAQVQAKYAPLIADTKAQRGVTVIALEALKKTLSPWLIKLDNEKRAIAEAAAKEAEAKAQAAAEAMRAASGTDLEAQERAEALVAEASAAQTATTRAANDKAQAQGGGRATGLRSYFTPEMVDAKAALKHYMATNPQAIKDFLLSLAKSDVAAGKRTIPGFTVNEEKRAV